MQHLSNFPNATAATILVVDDDRAIAALLTELLSDQGYTVRVEYTLADAARSIAQDEPDVLLLDVLLPDGSGLDLCAQLQSNSSTVDLPILLLSATESDTTFIVQGLDGGGYDFLAKPFYNDELLARVRVLVRLRKLQQRLIEQERDRAMLATAGAASHTLGQPLMAALGLVRLLLRSDLTAEQQQDMEAVYAALKQMAGIVRQIQDVQHYTTLPYLDDVVDLEILDLEQASNPRPPENG